jgi:hypothetical protein
VRVFRDFSTVHRDFSKELSKICAELGKGTQARIARRTGVAAGQISNWRRGKRVHPKHHDKLGAAIKGEWDQAPSSSANGAHARHNGQAEFSSSAAEFVQASVAGGLPSGKTPRPFVVRYFSDLHTLKATTREMVVAPWLPTQTAAMIYAWRGTGKSLLALSMAIYIAAGRGFGPWHIPKPRKVIYIDGELSLADLKLRYRDLVEKLGFEPLRENLRLVSMIDPDQPQRLNLADARHHDLISSAIGDAEVVFLDSSVSLWSGKEVDAWSVVQPFMLDLRQRGKAVIFMHQAGKDREAWWRRASS